MVQIPLVVSQACVLKTTDAIQQIIRAPPATLNTIHKLADSINSDHTFYNTINNRLKTNANSSAVMQPVFIDQGCMIQTTLSLGSYSLTNPFLRIETTTIQNGSITTSNNINAGVNIYATEGINKNKYLEITSTSTITGNITT